jgi:hypothetical protein
MARAVLLSISVCFNPVLAPIWQLMAVSGRPLGGPKDLLNQQEAIIAGLGHDERVRPNWAYFRETRKTK